jgi:uncharacterized protein YbbC (DUF1343 family)
MIETPHRDDPSRRVPIYSLYSETREPTADMLRGLDVLVIDLQDIGARIYTYIYTMANCLKACARHGIPVIVCDRPNPINGVDIEGALLVPGFESFVGLFPIPMRHGMTIGELARLFNERFGLGATLEVVPMEGWRRDQWADTTSLPWVIPSPNMPTLDSAAVYPGTVLFEGTMLSEGRGTTRPFELVGAPWIEAERVLSTRRFRADVPETRPSAVRWLPDSRHGPNDVPPGADRRRADSDVQKPEPAELRMAAAAVRVRARQDADRHSGRIGSPARLRRQIESNVAPLDIAHSWREDETAFEQTRRPYLLY